LDQALRLVNDRWDDRGEEQADKQDNQSYHQANRQLAGFQALLKERDTRLKRQGKKCGYADQKQNVPDAIKSEKPESGCRNGECDPNDIAGGHCQILLPLNSVGAD